MSDLISRQAAIENIRKYADKKCCNGEIELANGILKSLSIIKKQPTAYDVEYEIRLLKNYINKMPKVYRKRNVNWVIVRDLIMQGTSTAGKTSCITRCCELAIDPWGYELKGAVKNEYLYTHG